MDSEVVIRAEGLGKKYTIGHQSAEQVPTLRDSIARNVGGFVRSARDMLRGKPIVAGDKTEEFWALRDVSFEVRRGEVLGIIGSNGAGKSTLLKVLSRITEPSEGRVEIKGRIASLLEVGTGFHPELSGRENIYLNGAILGMSRREIRAKFDEIVAFAEVERFLDTPVKRYSSGMYVRLAFAVAAHLEPEILVVDEVLAVGDAEFQKKCLGKMSEVAGGGRTVLFVSHNMRAMLSMCDNGILLNSGTIEADGTIAFVAAKYAATGDASVTSYDLRARTDRTGTGEVLVTRLNIVGGHDSSTSLQVGDEVSFFLQLEVNERIGNIIVAVTIRTFDGIPIYCLQSSDSGVSLNLGSGVCELCVTLERMPLYPGEYTVDVWIGDSNSYRVDLLTDAGRFTVRQDQRSDIARQLVRENGLIFENAVWQNVTGSGA